MFNIFIIKQAQTMLKIKATQSSCAVINSIMDPTDVKAHLRKCGRAF